MTSQEEFSRHRRAFRVVQRRFTQLYITAINREIQGNFPWMTLQIYVKERAENGPTE